MAKYNIWGNKIIPTLCKDLDVPCKNIGSLVVGFSEEDDRTIEMLYKRGVQNWLENQRIIKQPELSVTGTQFKSRLYKRFICTKCMYYQSLAVCDRIK